MLPWSLIDDYWGQAVRVALDDVTFSGRANLAVLVRCNFDLVKIDRSLVSQIDPQRPSPEWLETITALIRGSRLEVIAEGVETEQQLTVLRAAKVQAAQGFYFSRPLSAVAFIAYHHASHKGGGSGGSGRPR